MIIWDNKVDYLNPLVWEIHTRRVIWLLMVNNLLFLSYGCGVKKAIENVLLFWNFDIELDPLNDKNELFTVSEVNDMGCMGM